MSTPIPFEQWRDAGRPGLDEFRASVELPTLTGTERQVAWALKLRAAWVETLCSVWRTWEEDRRAEAEELLALSALATQAKFWIDTRADRREFQVRAAALRALAGKGA